MIRLILVLMFLFVSTGCVTVKATLKNSQGPVDYSIGFVYNEGVASVEFKGELNITIG